MRKVSPHSLEGDNGWQMRDTYAETMAEFDKYVIYLPSTLQVRVLDHSRVVSCLFVRFESGIVNEWQLNITSELTERLKQPLLVRHTCNS